MELAVVNQEGKEVDKVALADDSLHSASDRGALYQVVKGYLANQRQGTASTKTRGEVSGGGKKPWRQKGTGRARVGSIRSPLWRKGGVVFGPHPRDFHYSISPKIKTAALKSAFTSKFSDKGVIVVDDISMKEPKTKALVSILNKVGGKGVIALIIKESNESILRSGRNIARLKITRACDLTAYEVAACDKLILTKEAFESLKVRLGL